MGQTNVPPGDVLVALAPGPGSRVDRLERGIRDAVRSGRLAAGTALPPSRVLAASLGVSRWVVTEVYRQLVAEGLLAARAGSATRVAGGAVPHHGAPVSHGTADDPGHAPATLPDVAARAAFDLAPGIPDLRHVPREAWTRAGREAMAEATNDELFVRPPGGLPAVRSAVAGHLRASRAVAGPDGAVVLTGGAADAMRHVASALVRAGHTHLLVEEPSWAVLRDIGAASGLEPVPVGVDDDGVVAEALAAEAARTGARAVLLTPAHQFPTGAALSPGRRERVLAWARSVDGLVIEDDYDAEFRYDRRPVAALQGLDPDRVLLLGSLSKTLAPAFGVGWMVVPERWRAAVLDAAGPAAAPSTVDQLAFARMLANGSYARHLRAARKRYHRRRDALVAALARELPQARVTGIAAGMHLVLDLAGVGHADAADVTREAAARHLTVADLRRYQLEPSTRSSRLVVGYGNLADARVHEAARLLAEAARS